jgi:hypothetical protein
MEGNSGKKMKKALAHIIDRFKFQVFSWGNGELIQWTKGSVNIFPAIYYFINYWLYCLIQFRRQMLERGILAMRTICL